MNSKIISEAIFIKDLITRKFPTGIVSVVSDSFDFWSVLTDVLPALKDTILAREASAVAPGKLVIRPDSGDPVAVVCGMTSESYNTLAEAMEEINAEHFDEAHEACEGSHNIGNDNYCSVVYIKEESKYYELTTPFNYNRHDKTYYYIDNYGDAGETVAKQIEPTAEQKGAVQVLWETFGGTITDKGYKMLDSHIGLIYGDSITTKRAEEILRRLANMGFASGNIVFGVGSYTYQCNTRDTFGMAIKATYTEVNGKGLNIFKDPATDSKKKSAKGLLRVNRNAEGCLVLEDQVSLAEEGGELVTIFKDGVFTSRTTLAEIRERITKKL